MDPETSEERPLKMAFLPTIAFLAMVAAPAVAASTDAGTSDSASSVKGSLSPSEIAGVIRQHLDEVAACYRTALGAAPGMRGDVVASFTVESNGRVHRTELSSSANNLDLEMCLGARIRNWQFPKPHDGGQVVVTYPFRFK